jgi:hypothetical protein
MCGVVPENLIMVLGSRGASSVIRRQNVSLNTTMWYT